MSFLNQLKTQASALQTRQSEQAEFLEANTKQTELACQTVALYFADLAQQLNVIQPDAPRFTLDGRTPWPAMKLGDFRVDSRKKKLRDRDVYDYVAMGWQIAPKTGEIGTGVVSVNFPPDLERVEKRLGYGGVKFERKDIRHPESNKLQAIRFEYQMQARGYATVTADHDEARLHFRLANLNGFDIQHVSYEADQVRTGLLDELAKLVVGQASRFL